MNANLAWLEDFLGVHALKIEVALLLLSSVSMLLYNFHVPSANFFIVLTLNLAAIFYMFSASFEVGKGNQLSNLASRVTMIASSMVILGTLFRLLNYPTHQLILEIGVLSMFLAVLIHLVVNLQSWSNHLVKALIRVSLIAILGIMLWLL